MPRDTQRRCCDGLCQQGRRCPAISHSIFAPTYERGAIHRKGRDWPAPPELWRSAIEVLLAKRDARTLTLPLSSHGLLYEVLAGLSDKLEGLQERSTEADRRQRGAVASTTVSANTPPLYKPEASIPGKPTPEQLEKLRTVSCNTVSSTATPATKEPS